ncbi:enoyl-CoA hydratase/isomerase family protein [Emcibacter nanhaiensis]|uniref:Enoyl-CoA hydratase/isomerase family protein n=1 Tax=Emcibacter nanhaiensis TaxID=1505037 RepID=A0A501PSX2_9PROT|nr:enoyl-CoA hydratase/isomerase family protein [Emcibacter nanhaiensis]TPD63197.1 enoyl-CoA hydratase/isomerase family protein [Emcibacter nanhaiensis]
MTGQQSIICTLEDGLCRLTLNRPDKLNALNVHIFEEIAAHLDTLDYNRVGCLLLSGAGRSFCAGHDLDDLASGDEGGQTERIENGLVERLATLPFPVVASVRGHCYTGGLELVLAADIIVAAENARFADTHAKFDLVPIWGLSQRLPRRVGMAKAKEMIFASRTYSGAEAVKMGLANLAVPEEELDSEVEALCADILANSRRSNRAIKKLLQDTDGMSLAAGNAWELHHSEGHGPGFAELIRSVRAGKEKNDESTW